MGRQLRFENAKARRSLFVSYRTPMQFTPCESPEGKIYRLYAPTGAPLTLTVASEDGPDVTIDSKGVRGRWIEIDLPDVLRIWKPYQVR